MVNLMADFPRICGGRNLILSTEIMITKIKIIKKVMHIFWG